MNTFFKDGWHWPEGSSDEVIYCHVTRTKSLEHATNLLPLVRRRVCVQAGGSHGMWPKRLGQLFERVYTFEPDAISFDALSQNCREPNIVKLQAALGSEVGSALIRHKSDSTHYIVDPKSKGACKGVRVPLLSIDAMQLENVDAIMLDVEGYEKPIIVGAEDTIRRCRPVILTEYNPKKFLEQADETVLALGYMMVETVQADRIYIPKEGLQ